MGGITNPRKADYDRAYNRTTVSMNKFVGGVIGLIVLLIMLFRRK